MSAAPMKPSEALRKARELTDEQREILTYLRTQAEGAMTVWIAEACGHFYDTAWAANRLKTLNGRGLVVKLGLPGWWRLADKGRAALAEEAGQ